MPSELALLTGRVRQLVTLRIRVERLKADADLDPLTGLANRRRFRKALVNEVERWQPLRCTVRFAFAGYRSPQSDQR